MNGGISARERHNIQNKVSRTSLRLSINMKHSQPAHLKATFTPATGAVSAPSCRWVCPNIPVVPGGKVGHRCQTLAAGAKTAQTVRIYHFGVSVSPRSMTNCPQSPPVPEDGRGRRPVTAPKRSADKRTKVMLTGKEKTSSALLELQVTNTREILRWWWRERGAGASPDRVAPLAVNVDLRAFILAGKFFPNHWNVAASGLKRSHLRKQNLSVRLSTSFSCSSKRSPSSSSVATQGKAR